MKRSQLNPMPEYFDRYINKCDDVELLEALQICIDELDHAPIEKWKALGQKVYAPGKWTINDLLQHMIDTERIFCFRALVFARGEKQSVPSFDEDGYALSAQANSRSLESLVEELKGTHRSAKALFESFTPQMLSRMCKGFKGEYSVASVAFVLAGHQRWHFQVMEEKYFPILG